MWTESPVWLTLASQAYCERSCAGRAISPYRGSADQAFAACEAGRSDTIGRAAADAKLVYKSGDMCMVRLFTVLDQTRRDECHATYRSTKDWKS